MMTRYLATALLLFLGLACQQQNPPDDEKYQPTDHLMWQRSFPTAVFDATAWQARIAQVNQEIKSTVGARNVGDWVTEGPGNAGARINSIAVSPTDADLILIGYSAGGIYKTTDGGDTWKPVFDDFPLLAIGDLVFDPSNTQVVYAGTGDPNISGIPFVGKGIYRSNDAGETWQHLGLAEVGIISEIIVDDTQDIIYAATMGVPYFRSEDRGLYKSDDGGKSWQKILFLGTGTGVIDIAVDPSNTLVLYAAGWDRIRNYEESTTTGEGAKIYKSEDGGENWTLLQGGLPNGEHSRIGIEISVVNPQRLFAVYVDTDHELEDVYVSDDGGETWITIPTKEGSGLGSAPFGGFGWYFGKIRLNPENEDDLYLLGVRLWHYDARLKRWSRVDQFTADVVHADKHDLAFISSDTLLLATDGGLYKSTDLSDGWHDIEDIPTTQFYRVAFNPHQTDIFYGGAQDNGSLAGNITMLSGWQQYFGGDGFRTLFHPDDPLIFYVETQNGGLVVTTDGGQSYAGATKGIDQSEFINWDAPVIMSHHDPNVLYYGTDRVYRSTSGAEEDFKVLSPALIDELVLLDATSNISVLAESYISPSLLFAATGDGNVYRSLDEGMTWEKTDQGLPDRYVTDIEFSPDVDSSIFISHSGFKQGEDLSHLHWSADLGSNWLDITGDLPALPVNSILVLPHNQDQVLFVGTDAGVYFTRNQGDRWLRLGRNMPTIPVFDLVYNPIKNLLVAGTHAKSIMSYDLAQEGLFGDINTDVKDRQFVSLQLGPNPVRDFLSLLTTLEIHRVEVIDTQGAIHRISSQQGFIDVSQLMPGVYVIRVFSGERIATAKFIKN